MKLIICNRDASLASVLRRILSLQGVSSASMAVHRMESYAGVTHSVKDAVMKRVSPEDLRAVGAKNPDIGVVSRKDDRIVLTPPRLRAKDMKSPKKHITGVRARDIFGPDWKDHLPITFTDRLRQVIDQIETMPAGHLYLNDPSTVAIIVHTAREGWMAFIANDAEEPTADPPL